MSEIVSPRGEILQRLSKDEQEVAFIEINLEIADNKKINAHNDLLANRRVDQYSL